MIILKVSNSSTEMQTYSSEDHTHHRHWVDFCSINSFNMSVNDIVACEYLKSSLHVNSLKNACALEFDTKGMFALKSQSGACKCKSDK